MKSLNCNQIKKKKLSTYKLWVIIKGLDEELGL